MKTRSLATIDANTLGLQFDETSQYIYGSYKGYLIYLRENFEGAFALFTSVKKADQGPNEQLRESLLVKGEAPIDTVTLGRYQLSVLFKSDTAAAPLLETITRVLDWVTATLATQGWTLCCEETGQTEAVSLYELNRQVRLLTESTYNELSSKLAAQQTASERYFLGGLGAILAGLLAGALLLFIAFQGYAIWTGGFLVGLLSFWAYSLLAKKFTPKSLVVAASCLILVVAIINELDSTVFFVRQQGLDRIGKALADVYINQLGSRDGLYWNNFLMLAATAFLGAGLLAVPLLKKGKRPITYRQLLA